MDSSLEAKLNKFSNNVLNDAHNELEELKAQIDAEKKSKIESKYDEFLKEAYEAIQNCITKIQKEDKEKVRIAEFEAKKILLKKREAIIDDVFLEALKKLYDFKKSDEYTKWLKEKTKASLALAGKGEKQIFVAQDDLEIVDDFKTEGNITPVPQEKFIGGVRVKNSDRGILVDYSFYELLEEKRAGFLQESGLVIE